MGQPLLFSCRCWRCKEREVMEMAPPAMRDSSIALLPWLPGFPPWAFRTTVSSLTSPWSVSAVNSSPCPGIAPQSLNSSSQPSRGPASLSGVCMAAARTVWFLFHLGCHRSAVSLSALNVSSLTETIAPMSGSDPASVPPPIEGRFSSTHTPVFPPSSFVLPSFAWFYIFFFTSQVLLSAVVLHALLCLMVYSWCIHRERSTPRPPTSPPSCSPPILYILIFSL